MATVTGKRVILKNVQNEYLIPYTDQGGAGNPDEKTIIVNDSKQLVTIGNQTKDGSLNYDWFGTQEEYEAAVAAGTIQDDWTCFITDYQSQDVTDVRRLATLNNPFVLLEPRFFEQNPQNACWLESDGSFKPGTVYTDVYDALATELDDSVAIGTANTNGYIKRGLPVKDSNDTYTDTDFVINQTAHTFRLALKVNLAGGNAVVGNRMTLGLTNGTKDGYLNTASNGIAQVGLGNYGEPVSTTAGNVGGTLIGQLGITTDPTKSGIETDNSRLVLCFYVGEVITDIQVINGSAALTALDKKINTNLDNLPNSSKSEIAGYGMPSSRYIDLTLGPSGTTYTAPANGWLILVKQTNGTNQYVQFNATEADLQSKGMFLVGNETYYNGSLAYCHMPMKEGQSTKIYYNAGSTIYAFRFIYAEGSYFD